MKLIKLIAVPLVIVAWNAPVQADCFFNKAICQAICGADCCSKPGTGYITSGGGGLSQFSTSDLQREIDAIKPTRKNRKFLKLLKGEVASRERTPTLRSTTGGSATISN